MTILNRLLFVGFVLLACVGCDQSTKRFAEANLPHTEPLSFLADTVRLQTAYNEGAFLSIGASGSESWRLATLRIGVAVMLAGLLAYTLFVAPGKPRLILAPALLIGGGTSNLIDRFTNGGYVTDFINLGVGTIRTGIFNVADMVITAGVLLLITTAWQNQPRPDSESSAA
jgi:signal peptidase II